MTDPITIAIENLEIEDVYLRSLEAVCAQNFEPKYDDTDALEIQFLHAVARSEILELSNSGLQKRLFRVILALGVRWLSEDPETEPKSNRSDDREAEVARIEARLVTEYVMSGEIPEDSLDEFARRNASYHAWPYWREIVATQCARMNLPKIVLPTIQAASNRRASTESSASE